MAVEVITREDLNQFHTLLIREMNEIINSKTEFSKKWLKASEVRELLSISDGTLQNLRINGTLSYTKIGVTVYYSNQEIEKLLENNKVKAYASPFK